MRVSVSDDVYWLLVLGISLDTCGFDDSTSIHDLVTLSFPSLIRAVQPVQHVGQYIRWPRGYHRKLIGKLQRSERPQVVCSPDQ